MMMLNVSICLYPDLLRKNCTITEMQKNQMKTFLKNKTLCTVFH